MKTRAATLQLFIAAIYLNAAAVKSPEIHPDGLVTFRLHAPKAKRVAVGGDFSKGKPLPMKRGADGVWSRTAGPFAPDLYVYGFKVDADGPMPDPANPAQFKRRGMTLSFLDVPGKQPRFFDARKTPHGQLHRHQYRSAILKQQRNIVVYTPPGYRAGDDKKFPVLYLLQGGGDTEEAWVQAGRIQPILENLFAENAENKARLMIVVMPDARGKSPFAGKGKALDRTINFDEFEASMLREILPFVQKNYRANTQRAIAGFSVGAALSRRIGLRHLDQFQWVALMCGGTRLADGHEATLKPLLANPKKTNAQLKLLWISGPANPFLARLKRADIRFQSLPEPHGHSYRSCRHILFRDFLPQLFRE
jgi:enterochelin esterase family protein